MRASPSPTKKHTCHRKSPRNVVTPHTPLHPTSPFLTLSHHTISQQRRQVSPRHSLPSLPLLRHAKNKKLNFPQQKSHTCNPSSLPPLPPLSPLSTPPHPTPSHATPPNAILLHPAPPNPTPPRTTLNFRAEWHNIPSTPLPP